MLFANNLASCLAWVRLVNMYLSTSLLSAALLIKYAKHNWVGISLLSYILQVRTCLFMDLWCAKVPWHFSQVKGLSLVWILSCSFKACGVVVFLSQYWQEYGFSPEQHSLDIYTFSYRQCCQIRLLPFKFQCLWVVSSMNEGV